MGFLLGAYGKLLASSRVRSIEARMLNITRQISRAQREASEMQKNINRQVREMTNQMRLVTQNYSYGIQMQSQMSQAQLYQSIFGADGANLLDASGNLITNMNDQQKQAYQAAQLQYSNQYSQVQQYASMMNQQAQMMSSQQQQQIEQYKEYLEETQYQPLKDLEEDLTHEKETLESELALARQEKEFYDKMEQEGVKNMVPRYTGQG